MTAGTIRSLSSSFSETNTPPDIGSICPAPIWLLPNAIAKSRSMPITSPVERISGPEHRIDAGEAGEREHRLLDRDVAELRPASSPKPASGLPAMMRAAMPATGRPITLATNGTVRLARGLTSRM